MAGSPDWKVYRDGEYVAACKYAEDAAAMVAVLGGQIRYGHSTRCTVWREGEEARSAGENYHTTARVMRSRVNKLFAR